MRQATPMPPLSVALCALLVLSACGAQPLDDIDCPPDTAILPCRCRIRDGSSEMQIWCSHSDLERVLAPLRALADSKQDAKIDELILEGNRLNALPSNAFPGLRVVRLMLRENALERLSATALSGQETALTELFVVEPTMTHIAPDLFRPLHKLQAVTFQTPLLRRLPRIEGLPDLRYLRLEVTERAAWRSLVIMNLPSLQDLQFSCGEKGAGLDKLEDGMIQDTPRLQTIQINNCALNWLHPHTFSRASKKIETIDLSDNYLDDVGQVALAIRELPLLTELKLERNSFRGLPEGSLVSLSNLRSLSLAGNQIREVGPGAFHMLPNLEVLDMSRNELKRLHPQAFTPRAAPRLQELNLAQNHLGHLAEVRPWMAVLTSLVRLDVSENGISELAWAALGPHPNLERLVLDNNHVRVVRRDALSALPSLIDLKMRNNSLDEYSLLDRGSPWNLPGLKGLDLGQNAIRYLDARLLAGLPSLRRLDMSQNLLSELQGSPFSPAPLLEHLNLSGNSLQAMPSAVLSPLRALYEMDVGYNKLMSLPSNPGRALDQLGALNLEGNQLGSIPDSWTTGQSTNNLQLSGNSLRSMPRLNLPGLTRLDISRNLISRIEPETLSSARELVYLNASNNELTSFPGGLHGLASLRELDLNDNRLSSLPNPEILGSLQSLRILRVARNQLTTLPAGSLHGLPRLTSLALSENRVTDVDRGALSDLPSLAELDLSRNSIQGLPRGAFSQMPSLRAVSLQGNMLQEFQAESFEGAPRLLLLDLSHNQIRQADWGRTSWGRSLKPTAKDSDLIPAAMPGLEVLDLSHNHLRTLEDAGVNNLPWLVELKVNNNEICGIREKSIDNLSRLRVLSLRNNKVTMMQERAFRALKSNMMHLDIAGNPLSCSCGLMWLQEWMDEAPQLQPRNQMQESPRCADGTLLREVALSRANCHDKQQRDEEDLLASCSESQEITRPHHVPPSSSQLTAPSRPPYSHGGPGNPNPEESEYFLEDYVDYPQGASENLQNQQQGQPTTQQPPPQPIAPPTTQPPQQSQHYTTGETPTFYAGSINFSNLTNSSNLPSKTPSGDGPFTLFGYPLPSISNLWQGGGVPSNGLGRTSGKRLETGHTTGQVSHIPYEEGFVPSVGPVRPPWIAPAASNATFKFEQQKEFHKQDHNLRFPAPTVNSKGPFDHRGSLPIRDDPMTTTFSPSRPTEAFPTVTTQMKPVLTQKGVLPLVFAEHVDTETAPKQIHHQSSTMPMRTMPQTTTTEASTTPDFSKIFPQEDDYQSGPSYPSGSEYPNSSGAANLTFSSKFNNENSSQSQFNNQMFSSNSPMPNIKDSRSETPNNQNLTFSEQVTNSTSSKTYSITTNEIRKLPTFSPPTVIPSSNPLENTIAHQYPASSMGLVVPTIPPKVAGNPANGNIRATITKVEGAKGSPGRSLSAPTTASTTSTAHTDEPSMTTVHAWYYKNYNQTNLEPFRGEYLQEEYVPSGSEKRHSAVIALLAAGVFIFMY